MKHNPMLAHFERESAKKRALKQANDAKAAQARNAAHAKLTPQTEPDELTTSSSNTGNFELRFFADQQQVKAVQSELAKRELKAKLLPNYLPWIDGTLTISPAPQNDMLVWLMVWAIDARNYQLAYTIASHCLLNDMVMPAPFTRDIASVFAEQLAEGVLEDVTTASNYADILEQAVEMLKSYDMVDEIRAKLYKAFGLSIEKTRTNDAITAYETALRLNANIGVKKSIEALNRAIKRGDTPSAPDTQSGSQQNGTSQDPSIPAASTALPLSEPATAAQETVAPAADPAPAASTSP